MGGVRLAVVGPVFLGIRWGGGEETPPPCQAAPGVPGHDPPPSKALWGDGWRAYDAMFRQLAATNDTIDWSRLNPSLYATTFMMQQGG